MTKKVFPVIRTEKGLGNQKSSFIINHDGREVRVPLFNFQKENPNIRQIRCNIENGRVTQELQTITEVFYNDPNKAYLFKIKQKWDSLKYYELEDLRFYEDGYRLILPFSDSNKELKKGQYIKCKIKEIHNEKPHFTLIDADPSCIEFLNLDLVFNISENREFDQWIHSILKEDFMLGTNKLLKEEDGRWICLFAEKMKPIIYTLLLSDTVNKENILATLCQGWIITIEHSSFISNMSKKEYSIYNKDLTSSIEICEDFLDALSSLQRNESISDIVASLNPQYFQYRIERKLRFMACAFAMNKEKLKEEMPSLLMLLKAMGEDKCCADDIYLSLATILRMYTNLIIRNTINVLSIPSSETINIKSGILSLCYLVRMMTKQDDKKSCVYISKIFLLISLYMAGEKEKQILLKNAYYSLFSNHNPISRYKWEELENVVKSQLYLFCQDISTDLNSEIIYNHDCATATFSEKSIVLSPRYYDGNYALFNLRKGLSVKISSEKNLSNFNENFLEVQNAWRDAMATVFTPVTIKIEKNTNYLQDGDIVEIYITDIMDDYTAKCKVAGYDIEGAIPLKKLLFYEKPNLRITDFQNADGNPLLFQAEYHIENDNITFDGDKYKYIFLREAVQVDDEFLCMILSKNKKGLYVCVTFNGFFILVDSKGEELELYKFITAIVVRVLINGTIQADFEEYSNDSFDNREAYSEYLKSLNQHEFEDEYTLKDWEEGQEDRSQLSSRHVASKEQILSIIDIITRLSTLETDLKTRYGNLYICQILTRLIGDSDSEEYYRIRLKYTQLLYSFSLNNKLTESELSEFQSISTQWKDTIEIEERKNVLFILSRLEKWWKRNEPDNCLIKKLTADCSVLEKELSKLVLSSCLLSRFENSILQERILDEIGNLLNIKIIKHKVIHIGEESQKQEFKTSIVFPPNNRGNEDIEQQSDNIIRSILSMMNAKGGVLYIGVNDDGNVVGIHNDLAYFSENMLCGESKAKDNFLNHFSCLLTDRLGAINAAKFNYYFKEFEDYTIFQVDIPVIHDSNISTIRVGNTVQKINTDSMSFRKE